MQGMTTTTTVTIDFDADRWELFDEKGRDEAAAALNTALQTAVNAPGSTASTVRRAMAPVCSRFAGFGASDSEADRLIERVIRKVYGEDA
jgi:hypothetical protein